ncbi:MAG: hypothetical protein QOF51_372 [Chloroflexota bacterium]|jgi:hypothetical protein|nr:hypothetical protein [Chloroflexota bacterium]
MDKPLTDMTAQEQAADYDAHRDDPDGDWEEVPSPLPKRRPGRPTRGYTVSYAVRFTPEEFQRVEDLAGRAGITGSELIRRAVAAYRGREAPATEATAG